MGLAGFQQEEVITHLYNMIHANIFENSPHI